MAANEKRFDAVYQERNGLSSIATVLVDRETGVNYLFVHDGHAGGLTVLLDAEGRPVITPKDGAKH